MIHIPGVVLEDELAREEGQLKYGARQAGRPVVVNVLKPTEGRSDEDVRRDISRASTAVHPGLTRIVESGRTDNGAVYWVREQILGPTLASRLRRGPMQEHEVVRLAKSLADALACLHRRDVIHRGVRPDNIVMLQDGQCQLVDLGYACSTGSSGGLTVRSKRRAAMLYHAPEQLGQLQTPVDQRSDLYALGVLLYHALCGDPPFTNESLTDLAQAHSVVPPKPLRKRVETVSPVLESVIDRLLAKDPAERYQFAEGVVRDLDQLGHLERHASGSEEQRLLSTHEQPLVGHEATLFVGREVELARLACVWQDTVRGESHSVVLLEGECGSGKTRLIDAFLEREVDEETALVLEARVGNINHVPLSPAVEALREWLERLQSKSPQVAARHRERVVRVLGELGHVLCELLPSARDFLGAPSGARVPRIVLSDVVALFQRLFSAYRSAVFIVEDVQLLDEATLALLKALARSDTGLRPLIVMSASSTLNTPANPRVLAARRFADLRLPLAPIQVPAVEVMLRQLLGADAIDTALVARMHRATKGNPLGLLLYVREALCRGDIGPQGGLWAANAQLLEREEPFVVREQLRVVMEQLSSSTRELLSFAALWGRAFTAQQLASMTGMRPSQVAESLHKARRLGLVESAWGGLYRFRHAESMITLRAGVDPVHEPSWQFEIVRYLQETEKPPLLVLAAHVLRMQVEDSETRALLMRAGARAAALAAPRQALRLLESGMAGIEDLGSDVAPEVLIVMGQACVQAGDRKRAEECLEAVIRTSNDRGLRVYAYHLLIDSALLTFSSPESAVDIAIRALGEDFSDATDPTVMVSWMENAVIAFWLAGSDHALLLQLDKMAVATLRGDVAGALRARYLLLRAQVALAQQETARARKLTDQAMRERDVAKSREVWMRAHVISALAAPDLLAHDLPLTVAEANTFALGRVWLMDWAAHHWLRGRGSEATRGLEPIAMSLPWSQVALNDSQEQPVEHYESKVVALFERAQGPFIQKPNAQHDTALEASGPFHLKAGALFDGYGWLDLLLQGHPTAARALNKAIKLLAKRSDVPTLAPHVLILKAGHALGTGAHAKARKWVQRAQEVLVITDNRWARLEAARLQVKLLQHDGHEAAATREAEWIAAFARDNHLVVRAQQIFPDLRHEMPDGAGGELASSCCHAKHQLDSLLEVCLASSMLMMPDEQIRLALDEINRIFLSERACLFTYDDKAGSLRLQAGRDAKLNDLGFLSSVRGAVIKTAWNSLEPVLVQEGDGRASAGVMAAPLIARDRLLGVLYLDGSSRQDGLGPDDVQLLLAIANQLAVTIETSRVNHLESQFAAEQRERKVAEMLRDVANVMGTTLEFAEVLERMLESLGGLVTYDAAYVAMRREDTWEIRAARGMTHASELEQTIDSLLLESMEPMVVNDLQRVDRSVYFLAGPKDRSWMGLPLLHGASAIGFLVLTSRSEDAYSSIDADIAFTFAGQAAIALENARLFGEVERLAVVDGLTQLLNRRAFFGLADREFRRSLRYDTPLSAIMIDVDHFKRINDTYGHSVGDLVLQEVAELCRLGVRDIDVIARYGGEEFVVLTPETQGSVAAITVAERLRACIEGSTIRGDFGEIRLTASLGVASIEPGDTELVHVIERADRALYQAKDGGRNRVVYQVDSAEKDA